MNARHYIESLRLQPHPEGGYFREVYRSGGSIPASALPSGFTGSRSFATSIYYLLEAGDYSTFHRIRSDEGWHFYAGGTLWIHVLHANGTYQRIDLGNTPESGCPFQAVVPAGAWFAAEPAPGTLFALTGCTVAPGFDFADFQMAKAEELRQQYPEQEELIHRLCRI